VRLRKRATGQASEWASVRAKNHIFLFLAANGRVQKSSNHASVQKSHYFIARRGRTCPKKVDFLKWNFLEMQTNERTKERKTKERTNEKTKERKNERTNEPTT
jgi:hypothetical protein